MHPVHILQMCPAWHHLPVFLSFFTAGGPIAPSQTDAAASTQRYSLHILVFMLLGRPNENISFALVEKYLNVMDNLHYTNALFDWVAATVNTFDQHVCTSHL